jgi:hypothetical protein
VVGVLEGEGGEVREDGLVVLPVGRQGKWGGKEERGKWEGSGSTRAKGIDENKKEGHYSTVTVRSINGRRERGTHMQYGV